MFIPIYKKIIRGGEIGEPRTDLPPSYENVRKGKEPAKPKMAAGRSSLLTEKMPTGHIVSPEELRRANDIEAFKKFLAGERPRCPNLQKLKKADLVKLIGMFSKKSKKELHKLTTAKLREMARGSCK